MFLYICNIRFFLCHTAEIMQKNITFVLVITNPILKEMLTIRQCFGRLAVALSLLMMTAPYCNAQRQTHKRTQKKQRTTLRKAKTVAQENSQATLTKAQADGKEVAAEKEKKQTTVHPKGQTGKASYYSRRATGARTSSGERLNNDSLVCAHRTHPFGTKLLVRNPANGKEVVVRVIDRGPFTRGRIIDLSYEAAKRIGMLSAGVAMVEVSVYDDTEVPYKPKEYKVPELELEMNDGGDAMHPAWKSKREEGKANNEK